MLEWLDDECQAAVARVMRGVNRRLHHAARSVGQKRRRERERQESLPFAMRIRYPLSVPITGR